MSAGPRARVVRLCRALPDVVQADHGEHAKFTVRAKSFLYYLDDHHGDGRVAISCKVADGERQALMAADPDRFFVPAYLGARGWVGVRLDTGTVDWDEIADLIVGSYRLVAPKRLAAQIG